MHVQFSVIVSKSKARGVVAAAGHLGLWPALYAGAVLCCFLQLSGLWRRDRADFTALASVIFTALGTYLIDRVKLWPRFADPADRISQPMRYAFLGRHDMLARMLAIVSLVAGAAFAWRLSRWAPLLVLFSVVGAALYAPRARSNRPRLKDIFLFKNFYTAAGLVAFAAIISLITFLPGYRPIGWWRLLESPATLCAAAILMLRVLIDAILCDIDDETGDRSSKTRTAVTQLGKSRVVYLATIAQLLLACLLPMLRPLALIARALWGLSLIVSTLLSLRVHPESQKNFIDLRFPIEAALITIILMLYWM